MKKYQWVAYGLDMFGFVIIETEAYHINEAHKKAVIEFARQGLEFDTVEPFDQAFVLRMKWLQD